MEMKKVLQGFLAVSRCFNNVSYYHGNLNYFITWVCGLFSGWLHCFWA